MVQDSISPCAWAHGRSMAPASAEEFVQDSILGSRHRGHSSVFLYAAAFCTFSFIFLVIGCLPF